MAAAAADAGSYVQLQKCKVPVMECGRFGRNPSLSAASELWFLTEIQTIIPDV